MNITTLKKELIQAYKKVYLHQEQEKQKRGQQLNSADLKKKLVRLKKIIEDIKSNHNIASLRQELHRCEGYFYLHPEAENLKVCDRYIDSKEKSKLSGIKTVIQQTFQRKL